MQQPPRAARHSYRPLPSNAGAHPFDSSCNRGGFSEEQASRWPEQHRPDWSGHLVQWGGSPSDSDQSHDPRQHDDAMDDPIGREGPAGPGALPLVPYKREGSGFGEPLLMNAGRTPKKFRRRSMDLSPVARRFSDMHQGVPAAWPAPERRGSAASVAAHGNPHGLYNALPQQQQQTGAWPPSQATPPEHCFGSYQQLPDPHTARPGSSGRPGSAPGRHRQPQHTRMEQPLWGSDIMRGHPAAQRGTAGPHAGAGLLQAAQMVSPPSYMPSMQDMRFGQQQQDRSSARNSPEADLHQGRQETSSNERESDLVRLLKESLTADRRIELARALLGP